MRRQRIFIFILTALLPLWGIGIYQYQSVADIDQAPPVKQARKAKPPQNHGLNLNPKVPQPLPDLNQGYLFNRERFLKSADAGTNDPNQKKINMESLQYNGSIIIGDTHKALVSYSQGATAKATKRTIKTQRNKKPQRPSANNRISQIISLGESIGGYTVTEVEPLQLTFTRGSHTVTKDLFSTEKQRQRHAVNKTKKAKQKTPTRARPTTRKISRAPQPKETPRTSVPVQH